MELVEECGVCSAAAEVTSQLAVEGGEYAVAERCNKAVIAPL